MEAQMNITDCDYTIIVYTADCEARMYDDSGAVIERRRQRSLQERAFGRRLSQCEEYMLISPTDPSQPGCAGVNVGFYTMPPKTMRQLSISEGHAMRRRHLAELGHGEDVDSSTVHFPECLVFHCFRGDTDCDDPSPPEACLQVADDGSCADPLCKWHVGDEQK